MIWFDLDGVLRDICTYYCGYQPDKWNFRHNGYSIYTLVRHDKKGLSMAPPYPYAAVVQEMNYPVRILSTQPMGWRKHTMEWLFAHLMGQLHSVIFVKEPNEKLEWLREGDILIDDNPNMICYEKIALVRRPWNTNINTAKHIISSEEDLRCLLKSV